MVLAYVRWFDSAITPDYAAIDITELPVISEMESAGLLVEEAKDSITLSLDRCTETGLLRLVLTIPRVNVRSIQKFSTVKKGKKNADSD